MEWHSPGFIGREWIETALPFCITAFGTDSPGFIGREWIETSFSASLAVMYLDSPGFIGREWIETPPAVAYSHDAAILPALLVGSGL